MCTCGDFEKAAVSFLISFLCISIFSMHFDFRGDDIMPKEKANLKYPTEFMNEMIAGSSRDGHDGLHVIALFEVHRFIILPWVQNLCYTPNWL